MFHYEHIRTRYDQQLDVHLRTRWPEQARALEGRFHVGAIKEPDGTYTFWVMDRGEQLSPHATFTAANAERNAIIMVSLLALDRIMARLN